jgi:hypothetical protein
MTCRLHRRHFNSTPPGTRRAKRLPHGQRTAVDASDLFGLSRADRFNSASLVFHFFAFASALTPKNYESPDSTIAGGSRALGLRPLAAAYLRSQKLHPEEAISQPQLRRGIQKAPHPSKSRTQLLTRSQVTLYSVLAKATSRKSGLESFPNSRSIGRPTTTSVSK